MSPDVLSRARADSPLRVGVGPDVAAIGEIAVGLTLGEGRIGEQRGGQRLEREPGAELLHHVGFGRIVEIDLDGAGPQHHVESHGADPRHVAHHDLVAALGHHRQLGACLVGPHAEAEKADVATLADRLDLFEMATRLGAGLVQILERRAGELELAGGFEADRAVRAAQGDDLAAFLDRFPAEFLHVEQDVADAARLVIGGRAVVRTVEDELLVLGADPPVGLGFLAIEKRRDQLVAALDDGICVLGSLAGAHDSRVRQSPCAAPALYSSPGFRGPSRSRQSPACAIQIASAASAAVSARRMRGPSEMGTACGRARIAARS